MNKNTVRLLCVLAFFCTLCNSAYSQANASQGSLKRIVTYYNEGRLDSAITIAEAGMADPNLINDSKFWFYDGLINKDLYKTREKGNPKSVFREKSAIAFQKALEMESDSDSRSGIKKNIKYIATTYHNDAVRYLKPGAENLAISSYTYDKYIELMKLADERFDAKDKEIDYTNNLGSMYAQMFEDEKDIKADAYYQLARGCYEKTLTLDSLQKSARYNLVVLETNYKTKQERLLKEESERKDQVILSLNAVKQLEDAKLKETQLQEEAKKNEVLILKSEEEKKDFTMKAEQERKDATAEKEREKQQAILWSVISGLIVVVVFAFFMYRNARQKAKLNAELATLSFVVSKSTNTVMIFNANRELQWVNDTFFDSYGMSIERYKKERGTKIADLSSHPEIAKLIDKCIASKSGISYESETFHDVKGKRWFQSMLSPIFDENGKLQNIMVIDADITALKIIEEELRQKNKDITDSIQYAKRLQQSILPTEKAVKQLLSESFILYKPKDIVSGDFYWMGGVENDKKIIVAAVDCTGHGVPGALLTVVGNDLLNHVINEKGVYSPKEILKEMNASIISRFALQEDNYSRDGMDMAIAVIDKSGPLPVLTYSGAYNPLYIIRNNELTEMIPLRHSIGSIPDGSTLNISDQAIEIKKGDVVYLFSDGYADQLNGKTGKKFMKGRFKQLLLEIHKQPVEEQKRILERRHNEWKGTTFQTDDMLVMGFRF